MRDEEFKKKLTEVSEWEIPKEMDSAAMSRMTKKQLQRLLGEDLDQTAGQESCNQTFPPKLIKLKYLEKPCEDCDKIVKGRCVEIHKYKNKKTVGFKQKCLACGMHVDPYTGEFTLTGIEASVKWNSYAKITSRRYAAKKPLPTAKTIIDNDQEKITIYHDDLAER